MRLPGNHVKKLFCSRLLGKYLPVERNDLCEQLIGFLAHDILRAVGELDHCVGRRLENLDQVMVQVKHLAIEPAEFDHCFLPRSGAPETPHTLLIMSDFPALP